MIVFPRQAFQIRCVNPNRITYEMAAVLCSSLAQADKAEKLQAEKPSNRLALFDLVYS